MQARDGDLITAGRQVAIIDPGSDQVWEALRALYVIGGREDLTAVRSYESPLPDMPDRIRQQAQATDEAIRNRAR
jgi:hypothetical protein